MKSIFDGIIKKRKNVKSLKFKRGRKISDYRKNTLGGDNFSVYDNSKMKKINV